MKIRTFFLCLFLYVLGCPVHASNRTFMYEALLADDFEKAYSFAHEDFKKHISKEFFITALQGWKLVEFKKLKSAMFGDDVAYDVIYFSVERDYIRLMGYEVIFWVNEKGKKKFMNFPFSNSGIPDFPILPNLITW